MAPKLHGRAFYESIGSPKLVLAPMVDQSEFAWRLLTRAFLPAELRTSILAYSPMLHAKIFSQNLKYREDHFRPRKAAAATENLTAERSEADSGQADWHLDGNPSLDRPLFMQFCANDPALFLEAAKHVQPYCDAVDLNLGCPQGIAKKGRYGAFLQEDWGLIYKLINTLHKELDIPVTAKFRIQETREKTLEYAKMILSAGASIITVHGRRREQKGHNTGLADWEMIKFLRDELPKETVIFANGNILQHGDIQKCMDATCVDGVMSAEGNLYDPAILAPPPAVGDEGRAYWRGKTGLGGYRMDAVLRRYLDILYTHVLEQSPPDRRPLFMASDPVPAAAEPTPDPTPLADEPPSKRQKLDAEPKRKDKKVTDTNFTAMQAHLFHLLRALISKHTNVRDALARSRAGDMPAYENVLRLVEAATKEGLLEYERDPSLYEPESEADVEVDWQSSDAAVRRCKRPYWVCQSHVRPLPEEAIVKGSIQLSKKELARRQRADEENGDVGLVSGGTVEQVATNGVEKAEEIPREGMVCG
ncbi:tRNA dihydrouridine synthase [Oleoguttula sp. CCFEE 5521]